MTIYPDNLPTNLRETGLFCCWKYEDRNGRRTKVPYNPRTQGRAQSTNPKTFSPLAVALETMERGGYDGIGVGIFDSLGAIDIDHCIDENGALTDMATDIVNIVQGYTEFSPSGKGLRVLFAVPDGFQYDKVRYYINNQKLGLEVYIAGATKKYVTVTGNAMNPGHSLEKRGEELAAVLEKYMKRPTATRESPSTAPPPGDLVHGGRNNSQQGAESLDDTALIERINQSRSGTAFTRLWVGDTSGYKSRSEADMAFCNILAFWTNRDAARMDRLFRQSGLMREKWDRRQSGSTYGAITIQNAVASCHSGYDPQTYQYRAGEIAQETSIRPPDYSDAGNATVFCRLYGDSLIFVDALGWLWWNGQRWERDDHKAMNLALALSDRMLKEALAANRNALLKDAEAQSKYAETGGETDGEAAKSADKGKKESKAFLAHAQRLRGARQLRNMLELSKPALVVRADRLDANPIELNTPEGIVNLTTGQLRPHERKAYCSQITEAAPGMAGAEMWATFLQTVTCGNGSVQGFLQLIAGMALIGTVYHEGIVIAYGGGRNGKSTFFNALAQVLGDYAGSIDIRTLTTDRANKGASLATLRGKRLVIAGELEEHQRLSVATLKQVASTDKLTIEEKYKSPETVRQTHTLILFTNHLPRVGSTDSGTWRRLIVVPFNATIPPGTGVQNYADTLAKEAGPAILAWAIEGAVNFVRNGFKLDIPDVVEEATEEYRQREDWLNNFIGERCIKEETARIGARALYLEYKAWAQDAGEYTRRENDFSAAMLTAGYRKVKIKGRPMYCGLAVETPTGGVEPLYRKRA